MSRQGQPETTAACTPRPPAWRQGTSGVWTCLCMEPRPACPVLLCTCVATDMRRAAAAMQCGHELGGNKRATYTELARLAANGMAAPLYMPMSAKHHRHSAQQRCRDGHSNGCQPACHKQLRGWRLAARSQLPRPQARQITAACGSLLSDLDPALRKYAQVTL